jgi:hypothetical protein
MPGGLNMDDLNHTQELIERECLALAGFLIKKNTAYGNSFASPIHVFAKSSPTEQLNVRIDDKLKRLFNKNIAAKRAVKEDTELDLLGYLVLKRVLKKLEREERQNAKC